MGCTPRRGAEVPRCSIPSSAWFLPLDSRPCSPEPALLDATTHQLLAKAFEPSACAGIDQQVAYLDDGATNQLALDRHHHVHWRARQRFDRPRQLIALVISERRCRPNSGNPPAPSPGSLVDQPVQRSDHVASPTSNEDEADQA